MGRYVEITKQYEKLLMYYYRVIPHDHPGIIPFYIGLNEDTKTVEFYKKLEEAPILIVDIEGMIIYQDKNSKNEIPRWLIFICFKKARDAFETRKFLPHISFQS